LPVLLIILVLLLIFGAKSLPKLGYQLGRQSRKHYRQAKWIWSWFAGTEDESIRAEEDYGRECAREFARQFSGDVPPQDRRLVEIVGSQLLNARRDPRRAFHFAVVPSNTANAYALPGGFVFVTKPLLDVCDHDPNKIAFFLGHEIAHVMLGHAKDQLTSSALISAVSARLAGTGSLLHRMVSKGYSRTLELEADRQAVGLAVAAGFDSHGSVQALRCLSQISSGDTGLAEYFSSHPSSSHRIQELEKMFCSAS
jgi:predicted Zn-dependent protease